MARMFPPSLKDLTVTGGQERLFALLERGLDDGYWVWFHPVLKRARRTVVPDFVVYGPGCGVVCLVLAEWQPGSVLPAGANYVRVRASDGETRQHRRPEEAAREAAEILTDRMTRAGGWDGAVRDVRPAGVGGSSEAGPSSEGGGETEAGWLVMYPFLAAGDLMELGERGMLPRGAGKAVGSEALAGREALGRVLAVAGGAPPVGPGDHGERLRALIQPQIQFFDLRDEVRSESTLSLADAGASPAEPKLETPPISPGKLGDLDRAGVSPGKPAPSSPAPVSPARSLLPESPIGFFLDRKQERMARELASPRTLVYGPAGSGKTVFLIARTRYWLDLKPESRVLLTCYNSSLASHIRRQFRARGIDPDGDRLTVVHYHDLCAELLGMGEEFHTQTESFYNALEPRVLQRLASDELDTAYDLILVDEGQDFTRRMFEVLVRMNSDGGELTVVCDPAQDIYLRWEAENLEPLGDYAVEHLVDCYRNTAPIFGLARAVMEPGTRKAMGLDRLEMTRPEDLGRTGPAPYVEPLEGLDALVEQVLAMVEDARGFGLGLSEVAVLYTDRHAIPGFVDRLRASGWEAAGDAKYGHAEDEDEDEELSATQVTGTLAGDTGSPVSEPDRVHFAEALERELNRRGVAAEWVARDFATRAAYDIAKERLTICTIHSAKGMDFHGVVLLGSECLPVEDAFKAARSSALLFTGITRARERLWIPWFEETGWVPTLRQETEHLGA